MMNQDIQQILITEEEINQTVCRLAKQIDQKYQNKTDAKIIFLCILKGSVVFMGDLMKRVTIPVEIDFMKVSSYGNASKTSGSVNILLDLCRKDIATCEILIIEDIIDSGKTLSYLVEYLKHKGAKGVQTCTLLDKPSRREVDFVPDFHGLEIPDEFVVGYGLDYAEKYRTLPYIGILKPEIYSKETTNLFQEKEVFHKEL